MGIIRKISEKLKQINEKQVNGIIVEHNNKRYKVIIESNDEPNKLEPKNIPILDAESLLQKWHPFMINKKHNHKTYTFTITFSDNSDVVINTMEHKIMNIGEYPIETYSGQFIKDISSLDESLVHIILHNFLALIWVA